MIVSATDAANSLLGRKLKDKWHVKEKITPKEGSTGGVFGVCYIVTDGEIDAFLKAINFQPFFHMGHGKPLVEILNDHTNAYKYELDLLMRCKNNRLSKVSTVLDQGEEFVEGYPIPTVPYLIFELADGDIRSHLSFKKDVEKSWKLKSLHDVAVGLKQLHSVKIGHQDLKPSNVLVFNEGIISKIGDEDDGIAISHETGHQLLTRTGGEEHKIISTHDFRLDTDAIDAMLEDAHNAKEPIKVVE